MKRLLLSLVLTVGLAFGPVSISSADEVERQPLDLVDLVELSSDEAASAGAIEDVDGGLLGPINGLLSLALTVGAAYLLYKQIENED